EHRLQMVGDAQTHEMPTTPDGIARIAAFCGQDPVAFRHDLRDRLTRTDILTTGFFAPAPRQTGPDLSVHAKKLVAGWSAYPALRSDRAQGIFRRLEPALLTRLNRAANPDEALLALDGFLAGLPAGVQIFSLFEANPSLVDLIIDIAATSPGLARHLARNAGVLDAVIGGSFWEGWPGPKALRDSLDQTMADRPDYEAKLDAARVWTREWHFRTGVHHLRGLIDGFQAGAQYADLAAAVVQALWPVVTAEFARRHGPPPGSGAAVLAMGSLGAGRLHAQSDLDLIVLYDAKGVEASIGPRPLPTRNYFARLTQALITALTAPMAAGRLYDVDMRLRPSGRQGPVAVSLAAFEQYQLTEAWTWEHLALTRAQVLEGAPDLARDIEALRIQILQTKGQAASVRADVADMRARIATAKPGAGGLDAKAGPGRLQDIELCAQMLALRAGNPERQTEGQIAAACLTDPASLIATYHLCWRCQAAMRLLTERDLDPEALGEGGRAFLLRECGFDHVDDLIAALDTAAGLAETVISAQLGP
ncbi:MAG: glutamine-synthetase adenylyltransferase, partial [Paracoccaceae bacterium]